LNHQQQSVYDGSADLIRSLIGNVGGGPASGRCQYYIADYCKRCLSLFYTWSEQNTPLEDVGKAYRLCPWCKGQCSAAQQDHRNAFVEANYKENKL
jgi:hypothetical protein